jgi:hypothetical protein
MTDFNRQKTHTHNSLLLLHKSSLVEEFLVIGGAKGLHRQRGKRFRV